LGKGTQWKCRTRQTEGRQRLSRVIVLQEAKDAAAAAVALEPGRIIEIPEDEEEDLDVDIWA
jgi:hypothetical protein